MAKIWLSSDKLASLTAKWYNTNREKQVCKFCNQGQVENGCSRYEDARKTFFQKNKEIDKIDLNHVYEIDITWKTYSIKDLWRLLMFLVKYQRSVQIRDASHNQDSQDLTLTVRKV